MVPTRGDSVRKTGHPLRWHGHPRHHISHVMTRGFTRHALEQVVQQTISNDNVMLIASILGMKIGGLPYGLSANNEVGSPDLADSRLLASFCFILPTHEIE